MIIVGETQPKGVGFPVIWIKDSVSLPPQAFRRTNPSADFRALEGLTVPIIRAFAAMGLFF